MVTGCPRHCGDPIVNVEVGTAPTVIVWIYGCDVHAPCVTVRETLYVPGFGQDIT